MSSAESATLEKPDHDGTSNQSSSNQSQTEDYASVVQGAEQPGLPRLNYNLKDHKKTLVIVVSLLVIESSLLPVALFYGLWFSTSLRHGISKSNTIIDLMPVSGSDTGTAGKEHRLTT